MPKTQNPDPARIWHAPTVDLTTDEGRSIDALYHAIRESSGSDGWNGGDVVVLLGSLFEEYGYGVESPYIPREAGSVHPEVVKAMHDLAERDVTAEVVPSDARGRLLHIQLAGGHILIGASHDIPDAGGAVDGWVAQYYRQDDDQGPVPVYPITDDPDPAPMVIAVAAAVAVLGGCCGA